MKDETAASADILRIHPAINGGWTLYSQNPNAGYQGDPIGAYSNSEDLIHALAAKLGIAVMTVRPIDYAPDRPDEPSHPHVLSAPDIVLPTAPKGVTIGHMILCSSQTAQLPEGAEVIQLSLLPSSEDVSIVYRY